MSKYTNSFLVESYEEAPPKKREKRSKKKVPKTKVKADEKATANDDESYEEEPPKKRQKISEKVVPKTKVKADEKATANDDLQFLGTKWVPSRSYFSSVIYTDAKKKAWRIVLNKSVSKSDVKVKFGEKPATSWKAVVKKVVDNKKMESSRG